MSNEDAKERAASLFEGLQEQMRGMASAMQQRAQLTGTGVARGKRVRVTVNADGVVIETKFAAEIDELNYAEIARAVTDAAQKAAAEVQRKTAELMAPVEDQRVAAKMPQIWDLVEEMPNLGEMMKPPEVSTAAPDAPERVAAAAQFNLSAAAEGSTKRQFTEVPQPEKSGRRAGVRDLDW